jgi:hypothetical protein
MRHGRIERIIERGQTARSKPDPERLGSVVS